MSKTFKSAVSHREVRIWPTDAGFAIAAIDDVSNECTSTQLAPTDAPAIALAILEAAVGGHSAIAADLADAMSSLRREVRRVEEWAKEAADREALEVEARGLRAAHSLDETQMAWEHLAPLTRKRWEKAALKAREIHGATK